MSKEIRITTVDNPYDPFTEWNEWYYYDLMMGYHTCERLATVAYTSENLSDAENMEAMEEAFRILSKTGSINKKGELIEYKKVVKEIK